VLLTGDFIDNIHQKWFMDYRKLERDHGYIQWFVPNFLLVTVELPNNKLS